MYKIMFVCTGNICRSPLAHCVFETLAEKAGLKVHVESSGTGGWHVGENADSRMRKTAKEHGYSLDHNVQHFRSEDLTEYDLILCMDSSHLHYIEHMQKHNPGTATVKLYRAYDPDGEGDVPDPYYGGTEGFEKVFTIVERTGKELLNSLMQEQNREE